MAKPTMNKALSVFVAAAVGAAAFAVVSCSQPAAQPPLAGAQMGGPFVLTDQDGRRFDSASLKGRYYVTYFGYTFCPDACPTDMQVLGQAMRKLDASDPALSSKVQPIFITVDPARDHPAELKQFVSAFYPRMIGLTGSEEEIAKVAKEYLISYRKQPPAPGATGYLMDHPRIATLYGPVGQPIALLPVDADADQVVQALRQWVK